MSTILDHPLEQSILLPFVLVLLTNLVLAIAHKHVNANRAIVISMGLGILISYLSTFGFPPFPARTSGQKLFYIVASFTVLGSMTETNRPIWGKSIFLLSGAIGLFWLTSATVFQQPNNVILASIGILLLWYATASEAEHLMQTEKNAVLPVIFIAGGLSGLAAANDSLSTTQTALSIAAGMAASYIFIIVRGRPCQTWQTIYIYFGPLLALTAQTLLYGGPWRYSVFVLFASLYAQRITTRIIGVNASKTMAYKFVLLFFYLIPVAISLALGVVLVSKQGPYN